MPRGKGRSTRKGRLRLPENGRTEPIRNWTTLFGPPADGPGASNGRGRTAESGSENPIARGVELGYRVMDEYVQQGRRMAGLRNGSGGGAEALGAGLPQLTERMFQYASDFASVWMEAMGVMMRTRTDMGDGRGAETSNGGGSSGAHAPDEPRPRRNGRSPWDHGAHTATGTAQAGGAMAVVVEVTSRRPVRALVDLRPGPIEGELVVPDLRAPGGKRPRLRGASLEVAPDGKRLTIRLKVPNDHPAGEYVGAIVDQSTAVTRGTLTVSVGRATS
jgi:hypothetical protein